MEQVVAMTFRRGEPGSRANPKSKTQRNREARERERTESREYTDGYAEALIEATKGFFEQVKRAELTQ
jgi:hypothetical protein